MQTADSKGIARDACCAWGKGIRGESQGNARGIAPVTGHPRRWRPVTQPAKGNRQPEAASSTAVTWHLVAHTVKKAARTGNRFRAQGKSVLSSRNPNAVTRNLNPCTGNLRLFVGFRNRDGARPTLRAAANRRRLSRIGVSRQPWIRPRLADQPQPAQDSRKQVAHVV